MRQAIVAALAVAVLTLLDRASAPSPVAEPAPVEVRQVTVAPGGHDH